MDTPLVTQSLQAVPKSQHCCSLSGLSLATLQGAPVITLVPGPCRGVPRDLLHEPGLSAQSCGMVSSERAAVSQPQGLILGLTVRKELYSSTLSKAMEFKLKVRYEGESQLHPIGIISMWLDIHWVRSALKSLILRVDKEHPS